MPEFGDIDLIRNFLKFFIDDSFVKKELDKVRQLTGKKNFAFLVPVEIHSAVRLLECLDYLIKENPTGFPAQFNRHMTDLIMLSLAANGIYRMCGGDPSRLGPPAFMKRLRDKVLDRRGFYHVMYELQMASQLHDQEKKVEFQDVNEKKWPDLHVSDDQGAYYVECKRLSGPDMFFEQMCVEIANLLDGLKMNTRIDIRPRKLPQSMEEVMGIVKSIGQMFGAKQSTLDTEELTIGIVELKESYRDGFFTPTERLDYDFVTILGGLISHGKGESIWTNPKVITIKSKEILLPCNAMESEIKKGYKQIKNIPEDEVGIICIDISPYITTRMLMKDTEFLEVERQAKAFVHKIFNGPHFRRLGGIVLTYNYKRRLSGEVDQAVTNVSQIVHDKVSLKMPPDFLSRKGTKGDLLFSKHNPSKMISEGIVARNAGRLEHALALFDMVTLRVPDMFEGWHNKALVLREMKRHHDALETLTNGLRHHHDNKQLLVDKAQCYLEMGDLANALKFLSETLRVDPDNPATWVDMAKVHLIRKDTENARRCLEKALNIDGNFRPAYDLLNDLDNKDKTT